MQLPTLLLMKPSIDSQRKRILWPNSWRMWKIEVKALILNSVEKGRNGLMSEKILKSIFLILRLRLLILEAKYPILKCQTRLWIRSRRKWKMKQYSKCNEVDKEALGLAYQNFQAKYKEIDFTCLFQKLGVSSFETASQEEIKNQGKAVVVIRTHQTT